MARLPVTKLHCLRCHHDWIPRNDRKPKRCPRCHVTGWQEEFERPKAISRKMLNRLRYCNKDVCRGRYKRILKKRKEESTTQEEYRKRRGQQQLKKKKAKASGQQRRKLPPGFERIRGD